MGIGVSLVGHLNGLLCKHLQVGIVKLESEIGLIKFDVHDLRLRFDKHEELMSTIDHILELFFKVFFMNGHEDDIEASFAGWRNDLRLFV